MNRLFRRFGMIVIAAPLFACGGSPTTPHVDTTVASTPQKCRRYATELADTWTFDYPGYHHVSTQTESCVFDKATHLLRCTDSGLDTSPACVRTSTYPSAADFIEEASAVGLHRESTLETTCGSSTTTGVLTYDGQKHLVRWQDTGASVTDATYSGWDALGRPTQSHGTFSQCTDESTIQYDDAARTVTTRSTASGPGPCNFESTQTLGFDSVGNFVNQVWGSSSGSFVESRAVTVTAEVCL